MRWPRTLEQCAAAAAEFSLFSSKVGSNIMKYCVGALDGTLVPMWCKDMFQKLYYCRKGTWALHKWRRASTDFDN
jgi:hypothetical protein